MRAKGRVDANQEDIVKLLRHAGYSVTILSSVGGGVPDLIAGRAGTMRFLECKVPKEKLTPAQEKFHAEWRGPPIGIPRSPDEALKFMQKEEGSLNGESD